MDSQDQPEFECVDTSEFGIPMPHTFTVEAEEKQILERSRTDEVVESLKRNGPRLLGIIDSRTFLLAFATVSLVGNMVSLYETWDEKYTPFFYFLYSNLTALGIHGLAERKPMLVCIYGAYLLATAVFESALSGAMLYLIAQPDFCSRLVSITDLSRAGLAFCSSHVTTMRLGIFGGILAQVGLDILVLTQMWKVFQWAELIQETQEEASQPKEHLKLEV